MRTAALRRAGTVWILIAFCSTGCAELLRRDAPQKQRFVLNPGAPAAVARATAGVLRVAVVRASPTAQNRSFVSLGPDGATVADYYHEFFAPPNVLLRDALVDWLRATGRFAAVVRGSEASPDWVLEVDLERMLADVSDPVAPAAEVALSARLLDARARATALVFERAYVEREPLGERAPERVVAAWNAALGRLLGRLADDLTAAIASAPPR